MPRRVDPKSRKIWAASKRAESRYGVALRKLAATVRHIIEAFPTANAETMSVLQAHLKRYAETIDPWARSVARRMLADVSLRDARAWEEHSRSMGRAIKREIDMAPTGAVMRRLEAEQVHLIKTIPLEAAEQVQQLAIESLSTGERYETIRSKVEALGSDTRWKATRIARTEISRASSNLTQARAQFIGSDSYIWRTAGDSDVRDTHAAMEGKVFRWDSPPVVDKGRPAYHAGCFPNCRCYAEPIIPDTLT